MTDTMQKRQHLLKPLRYIPKKGIYEVLESGAKKRKLSLEIIRRSIKALVFLQTKDKPDKFAGSRSKGAFVPEAVDFFEHEVIVSAELRTSLSGRIGSFRQIISEITVA